MKKKILIGSRARSRAAKMTELLEEAGYELILNPFDRTLTEAELVERIQGASAMVAGSDVVTKRVLEAGSPSLKIVAKQGVGYNTIDVETANQLGIAVTITPGANSKSVADLTMGLILAAARNIAGMDRAIRKGEWYRHTGVELNSRVLGIVGTGHIGQEVAKRAVAFGMSLMAYDTCPRQELVDQYAIRYVELDELFATADFVSLHAPALISTVGMVNSQRLSRMKSTAFLINTSRGELVVEDDLYEALRHNKIAGAALDVFCEEPPKHSLLSGLGNATFTAHAGAYTEEAIVNAGVIAAEEIIRVLTGQEPRFAVTN